MATSKEYAYYMKGNKVAIVQKDYTLEGGLNYTYDPDVGGLGLGTGNRLWKSPKETIADGLELQYVYSPTYLIESTDVSTTTVSGWDQDNNGYFRLRASGSTNWTSSPDLSSVSYIVLRNAGRWNGLHKVSSVTNNRIVTATKTSASTSETLFEETVTLYYDVSIMEDESFELDVTRYQANAVTYYVKAKYAEDAGDMEKKEYFMREFRRMVEKHETSKIIGPRILQGYSHFR